jgi:hypothetical protein
MANPSKFGMPTVMGGIQVTGAAGPMPGSLSAGDFERFAAQIKPIWELDDAPFAATAAMNAVDLASLQGGGGANAEVSAALNGGAPELLPSDLLVTEPLVRHNGGAPPAAQTLASQPPRYAPPASVRPEPLRAHEARQPAASSYNDDDDIQIKKSKAPLFIGGAVVLAVIGTIIGVVASSASSPSTTTPPTLVATTAAPAPPPANIPPPPAAAEIPPPPEPVAAAPVPAAVSHGASVASPPPVPPPVHPAQAAPPPAPRPPRDHTPPPRPPAPPAAGPKPPPKTGGIVRDNPF